MNDEKEFLVEARLQIAVRGSDEIDAMIRVKDELNAIIADSEFHNDPLNGAVIDSVRELTVVEP